MQGNNALLLVHFELIHRPKCPKNRNTQANASPQRWLVFTRKSLAGFARKLTIIRDVFNLGLRNDIFDPATKNQTAGWKGLRPLDLEQEEVAEEVP